MEPVCDAVKRSMEEVVPVMGDIGTGFITPPRLNDFPA
jgi:hypothetical protein